MKTNESIEVTEEEVTQLARNLFAEFEEHPPFENSLTPAEFLGLWKYLRLRDWNQSLALIGFGEMLGETNDPLGNFTKALSLFLKDLSDNAGKTDEVIH